MSELTERQKILLALVVHEYARTAAPVGSVYLVEQYHLDMSSATVRNELSALTEQGYLRQPHTSAGRVPTEEGYRYFVGRLLQETVLPEPVRQTISHQFHQTRQDVDQWMRLAASVLAHQSRAASVVTAPHPEMLQFKHLELISTRGRQVLMVMVLYGGEVRQRLIILPEPVSQEQLSNTADHLTYILQDRNVEGIKNLRNQLNGLDLDIANYIISDIDQASANTAGEVYLDGLTNVMSEPEFSGSDDARKALHLLEERSLLQNLLARTVLSNGSANQVFTTSTGQNSISSVQVLIGGEGTWDELRHFSVVLSRYGTPGLATGTLGVLGPMRLPYGRTISTMRFLSRLLSDLVSETLFDDR
ncbi:MAG: heat-inducible transcription repressor HrcA [Anaerolineaceae bacterium]|nr:heat-inducible transcription repressor HrcA [Anaerolineaceae bacterium]